MEAKNSINDENGCSTCVAGSENYIEYDNCRGGKYYQYDFRATDGELFSCVRANLEKCREMKDNWLNSRI
ncbi:MAG: DUF3873 domain-containing protein [Dysgonamonadaceae bacterium]|nr:DUF3873 domain-containing protein [Dysgonamonadaceae bacterium]